MKAEGNSITLLDDITLPTTRLPPNLTPKVVVKLPFSFSVPTPTGKMDFSVPEGSSLYFVGANGGGKTRLAAYIEDQFGLRAHRISAHRALSLNPDVSKIPERAAIKGLQTGHPDENSQAGHRQGSRWHGDQVVSLLSDFDHLLQTLFAQQTNRTLETHNNVRAGNTNPPAATKFEQLTGIWGRLLPHRTLHISGDDIQVSVPGAAARYSGRQLSDGERSVFYLIGQTLVAESNSLLIFDEPELHVHRSILGKLWDELEAARSDCGFVLISHDLEFVATRVATKYVVRSYDPLPQWQIDPVPDETGFDEQTATLILGSRRPILFVEGATSSLDIALYRSCYPDWTVIPREGCETVIHSVVTMRKNAELTRVTCAGLVDADARTSDDIAYLRRLGVMTLSVSEIENIILLPTVSREIAKSEGRTDADLETALGELAEAVISSVTTENVDSWVLGFLRRRIDGALKKIDLSDGASVEELETLYRTKTAEVDIAALAVQAKNTIQTAIANRDLVGLLASYDNKGLIAIAASSLRKTQRKAFEEWLVRVLRNDTVPSLTSAIRAVLPTITPA